MRRRPRATCYRLLHEPQAYENMLLVISWTTSARQSEKLCASLHYSSSQVLISSYQFLCQVFAESANDYDQCSDEHAFLLLLHFTLREWPRLKQEQTMLISYCREKEGCKLEHISRIDEVPADQEAATISSWPCDRRASFRRRCPIVWS